MVVVVVNVGAAETVRRCWSSTPRSCGLVGCQGRGYRGRGRRFRVESQEHVQGQQGLPTHSTGLPHTETGLLGGSCCTAGCAVGASCLSFKEVSVNLVVSFWRCGFQAFLVCVRWCHSAPYLPSRETEKGVGQKYLVWVCPTLVRVSSSCGTLTHR